MRPKQIQNKQNPIRDAPKEIMAEGIVRKKGVRYTPKEIELIKRRVKELRTKRMDCREISKIISNELYRDPSYVYNFIRKMIKTSEIERNHNGQIKFTKEMINFIKTRSMQLVEEGKNNYQSSSIIAKERGWKVASVYDIIRKLIENGELKENPNQRTQFNEEMIAFIKEKWNELVSSGKKDGIIAFEIAKQKGWNARSVEMLLYRLREKQEIGDNLNKQKRKEDFDVEEIDYIKKRWYSLSAQGLNDRKIAHAVAKEKGWKPGSVDQVLCKLRKNNEIETNRNNKKKFTPEEILFIKQRWDELSTQLNDTQISKKISEEKGWKIGSISVIIFRLREKQELPANPNLQKSRSKNFFRNMSDQEKIDYAKKIINQTGIRNKKMLSEFDPSLYNVLRKNNLLDQVFPKTAKKSESELLSQLKDAVEMYLGKGEKE